MFIAAELALEVRMDRLLRLNLLAELDLTYMEDATDSDDQSHENGDVPQPAFDQLVLPDGHKNIVLSLISQHYRNRDTGRRSIDQSDIVRGKGKRLTIDSYPDVS
jgi:hypothetical protein